MKRGALRQYVKRKYGAKGFTESGDIKKSILLAMKKDGNKTTKKRATFALNTRRRKNGKK